MATINQASTQTIYGETLLGWWVFADGKRYRSWGETESAVREKFEAAGKHVESIEPRAEEVE